MDQLRQWRVAILAALGMFLLSVPDSQAQQAGDDAVTAICTAMDTDAERDACLRGVAAARQAGAQTAEPTLPVQAGADSGRGFLGLGLFGDGPSQPPSTALANDLGAEMVGPIERTSDTVAATIVSFSEHVPGILTFDLDNGQVWRQVSDEEDFYLRPGQRIPVEMWSSWAGGYRMRLLDERLVLRVERIR